jgi:hypothetical protein
MSWAQLIADQMREQARSAANARREQAAIAAQSQRERGQIWGDTISSIGHTVASVPGQIQQATIAKQEAELRSAQIKAFKDTQLAQQKANQSIANMPRKDDGTYDVGALMQSLAAQNVPLEYQDRFAKSLDGVNGVLSSWNKTKTDHAADLADVILRNRKPGEPITADSARLGFAAAKVAGLATDADEQKFVELLASGAEPETVLTTVRSLGSKYKTTAPKFQALPANSGGILNEATGDVKPTGVPGRFTNETELLAAAADPNHPQHQVAVDALALKPKPAEATPSLQSKSVLLDGKPAEVTFNPKTGKYQDASGADVSARVKPMPPASVVYPKPAEQGGVAGTLDEDGLDLAATAYRLTKSLPARDSKQNGAIISRAAKQAKLLGNSPAQTVQKQAAYQADAGALRKIQGMASAAEAFEAKADQQAELIRALSKKVSRTSFPILNSAILSGKKNILGDADTQLLYNAITTFTAEYAKIMEGSTGSAAGSSDAARRAAAELISPALGKGTLAATIDLMQKEMRYTQDGYAHTITHITERMGGVGGGGSTPIRKAIPGIPGAEAESTDGGKTWVRVK